MVTMVLTPKQNRINNYMDKFSKLTRLICLLLIIISIRGYIIFMMTATIHINLG